MRTLRIISATAIICVAAIAAAGADTRLVDAVKSGDRAAAIALLGRRPAIDANARESDGTTALHWAIHHDDVDLVQRLIRAGANVKAVNQYGVTPLAEAAIVGNAAILGQLLEADADVNAANPSAATADGITPVAAAAGVGSRDSDTRGRYKTEKSAIDSVRLLLDRGASVNVADNRGQTPLHGAAFWGWNDLVQFLADRGARLDAKDRRGMTPLDSAMGRAGGNGFGGNRVDVHEDTGALLKKLMAATASTQ